MHEHKKYQVTLACALLVGLAGCPSEAVETTSTSGDDSSSGPGSSSTTGETQETHETGDPTDSATDSATTGPQAPVCGNGVLEDDEECDDGNVDKHDDCVNCSLARCGDAHVHDGVENCDDGNNRDDDSCPSTCDFARCGDSFTFSGVEECDDGNDDPNDGCDQHCVRTRVIFISSELFLNDFGGLFGADQACQTLAFDAGLDRYESFKAWLSDDSGAPALDFHRSKGRYALPTGIPIAHDWDDLTDGALLAPIDVDEFGDFVEGTGVFTNTDASGAAIDAAAYSCDSWTQLDSDFETWLGYSGATDSEWTDAEFVNPSSCGGYARLYCVEQ